ESQADADELIEEFGQTGAIVRTTIAPPPNDWTPGVETKVYHAIKVAVLPVELQDAGRDIGGTVIKSSDEQILGSVTGLTITPTTADIIMIDGAFNGDVYEGGRALIIVRNNTLKPAGVPVVHDMLASS